MDSPMVLRILLTILLVSVPEVDLSVNVTNKRREFLRDSKQIIKSGRHLIVGTIEAAPYIIIEETSDGKIRKIDGFVIEILQWIAKRYNFTYEYVKPPDMAFGAFVNGSWNGLVGMIVRGEVDIAATSLTITYARSSVVDFTLAFLDDPMGLLIPFPRLDSTISGIVKPFQYEVWIGITVSLFIVAIVLWSICQFQSIKTFKKDFKGKIGIFHQLWFLFRSTTNPDNIISFTTVTRIVVASWCLATLVLVNTYNSCLVSYLMAPKFIPLINTVEDLAISKDIQLTVLKDTFTYSMLASATSGVFEKLGNSLKAHPENLLQSVENLNDIVVFQRKAFVFEETALKMRIHEDFKATNQCRLAIAKESFLSDNRLAFALPKNSQLTNIFNHELKQLLQLGLLDHWTESYLPKSDRCVAQLSSSARPPKSNTSLTINYLSSAFLLFGVGFFTSIVCFLFELLSKSLNR